jgi:hypothetical protein
MTLWCDRLFTGGLLFLILATPFAFGTVHPWAYSTIEAVIFGLVIVWMAKLIVTRGRRSALTRKFFTDDLAHHLCRQRLIGQPEIGIQRIIDQVWYPFPVLSDSALKRFRIASSK